MEFSLLKILLEYETKSGKEIQVKKFENVEAERDTAWRVDEVKAFVDGEEAGYLKISYVPQEKFDKHFPTIFNYLDIMKGKSLLPREKRYVHWKNLDREDKEHLLKKLYRPIAGRFTPYNLNRNSKAFELAKKINDEDYSEGIKKVLSNFSDKEIDMLLEKTEKAMEKKEKEDIEFFKNFHVEKPLVDYIRVYDDYRRERVAVALYLEGAKWMNERGMNLHASGLQSPEAAAAWGYLEKHYNVKHTDDNRKYLDV